MKKFLAIVSKEILLLIRDWPGLAILFIMPSVLLIVITLTQERIIKNEDSEVKMILINEDSLTLGNNIEADIAKSEHFKVTKFFSVRDAENEVLKGNYQLAMIIPDSATEKLLSPLNTSFLKSEKINGRLSDGLADIIFIYDPALQAMYKDAIFAPLKMLVKMSAFKILMAEYSENIRKEQNEQILNFSTSLANIDFGRSIPDFPYKTEVIQSFKKELRKKVDKGLDIKLSDNSFLSPDLIKIKEQVATDKVSMFIPTPLQNNIPAFTLFAMFFIVIPLAGSIINEKNSGIYDRIKTLPVSYTKIISAKIIVFLGVCFLQFIILMLIGIYIMPRLGDLSSLDMNVNYPALLLALIASSLAATGFGIIVGTFSGTHGQAATFGSVMVVILAMFGGIFVPVNMLPESLKNISMISPLRWGTDAFLDVFSRNKGITNVWPELVLLICFFCISLTLSIRIFNRHK